MDISGRVELVKSTRFFALVFLLVCYLGLGILKWNYILNPGITDGPFLFYRYSTEAQQNYNSQYADSIRYFLLTPKWISTLIYGNLFLFLNLGIIYLTYKQAAYIKFTFWLFFWVSTLSFFALFLGFLTNQFNQVYVLVSRIKELQQSPFTLILMLAAFKLANTETKNT